MIENENNITDGNSKGERKSFQTKNTSPVKNALRDSMEKQQVNNKIQSSHQKTNSKSKNLYNRYIQLLFQVNQKRLFNINK